MATVEGPEQQHLPELVGQLHLRLSEVVLHMQVSL